MVSDKMAEEKSVVLQIIVHASPLYFPNLQSATQPRQPHKQCQPLGLLKQSVQLIDQSHEEPFKLCYVQARQTSEILGL